MMIIGFDHEIFDWYGAIQIHTVLPSVYWQLSTSLC